MRFLRIQFGHEFRGLPSGRYQVRFEWQGRQIKGPHTFKTKADAHAWLDDAKSRLRQGTWVNPEHGRVLFKDFALGYG